MFDLLSFTICNLIYNFFDRGQEANIYEIKSRRLRSQKVDIGNLEDLLRVVFNDEECGNLKVVLAILTINQKKKSDVLCDKCAAGEGISTISKWNIVNQLGKHDLSCGYVFLVGR